ncbi:uncharacterized protein KY384_004597 [Bacidia gigantensis]|uniref:uncharacterized protein n=1 Tax=Bacidia gigantensis TaxID=2732470 RepID=UPI001D037301|nr:uncharacterized protein KY384_004597 [Bacidia gigantensis]KAG8531239.1 hypothetical protein KY384_004597 [Bacidia gigantensis]
MDPRPHHPSYTTRPPSQPVLHGPATPSMSSFHPPHTHLRQEAPPQQTGFRDNSFFPSKDDRNGFAQSQLLQQHQEERDKNFRIAVQAEKLYGQGAKISQMQWDEARFILERDETEQRRRQEVAERMAYNGINGGRPEWTSASPSRAPQNHSATLQNHTSALPPPPPLFTGRSIHGPASPPYTAQQLHQPRDRPPLSTIVPPTRDLPTPTSSVKPSSMSISSMLGSEPTKPREPTTHSLLNGASPIHSYPPTALHSTATSPTKPSYSNMTRQQVSPEGPNYMLGAKNRFRADSGGYPLGARSSIRSDSPLQRQYQSSEMTQVSPRSDQGAVQEWPVRQERRSDPDRLSGRPTSQPSGQYDSIEEINRRHADLNARPPSLHKQEPQKDYHSHRSDQGQRSSYNFLNRQSHPNKSDGQEQPRRVNHETPNDRAQPSKYPFLSASSGPQLQARAPSPQNSFHKASDQRQADVQKGPMGPDALRRIRDERLGNVPSLTQRTLSEPRPNFMETLEGKERKDEQRFHPTVLEMERSESFDGVMPSAKDGEHSHRKSLAILLENHRRAGRVSPLPQPVHGAQSRTNGPSRDPGIKNEFSKVFMGVGSGAGLGGSGASTPFPPSPKQNDDQRLPGGHRVDLEMSRSRNGSRMGKRRKINDESKDADATMTNGGGDKAKRTRHHHHHAAHHHHHHHQAGTPVRVMGDPNASHHHHHHHHDGTIHYHPSHSHSKPSSTAPQLRQAPSLPPRLPKTTIDNTSLLKDISHLPRRHLGSVLYAPSVESLTSSPPNLTNDSKLPFATSGFSLPKTLHLEVHANCTLHVRIPALYLTPRERQAVCARAALWGSGVYTDDSDPLASAIHSGKILGAWEQDVDASLISPAETEEVPQEPEKSKAAILTLLIVPPLDRYTGTIRYGVKSRDWGRDHQGASFLVKEIRWVDDTRAVDEERGVKAKRERVGRVVRMASGRLRGREIALKGWGVAGGGGKEVVVGGSV